MYTDACVLPWDPKKCYHEIPKIFKATKKDTTKTFRTRMV